VKLLLLTSEPITAAQLRDALTVDADPADTEVMVVAPALSESPLRFWVSDADDAIARAEEVRRATVAQLSEDGVPATGDTGESDPEQAIADALATFPAERIVVFSPAEASDRHYRESYDVLSLQKRFGLPVDRGAL
jgi:hypothetical protein